VERVAVTHDDGIGAHMTVSPQDVLDFWFAEDSVERWFARDDAFDALIRHRYARVLDAAARGALDHWAATPAGWLALLIVLDQFSRNIHRNDPRAWVHDAKARELALAGIADGQDERLEPLQRVFAYLPLEHAEDLALQRQSVALFRRLLEQAAPDQRARFESYLDYAQRHCETIARYGRFPHRNALLGRPSTPDELSWLAQPGSGF
jgi:uncharacterized protein (DUF924 family)